MDYEEYARLCLDPVRLAALGRSAEGTLTPEALTEVTGASRRKALETIAGLRLSGLTDENDRLVGRVLREIAGTVPQAEAAAATITDGSWTAGEVKVLETFFSGEELVEIPGNRRKRLVVLERLAQDFEPGIKYSEAEVSRHLEHYHPDYAALRRYLVEESLMTRAEGTYWRTGGRFQEESLFELDQPEGDLPVISARGPLLATVREGVTLEPYTATHRRLLLRAADDERIGMYMSNEFPFPYRAEDADSWIAKCVAEEPPLNFGVFVGDELVGGVGCEPKSDILSGSAEMGWWLTPSWWGKGIAAAAVTRLVDYCFNDLDLHRVEAGIFLSNPASARVAEKAGLVLEGVARDGYLKSGRLVDRLLYGLARSAAPPSGGLP